MPVTRTRGAVMAASMFARRLAALAAARSLASSAALASAALTLVALVAQPGCASKAAAPPPAAAAVASATTARTATTAAAKTLAPLVAWTDVEAFGTRCRGGLARAEELRAELQGPAGARRDAATLATYNRLLVELDGVANLAALMANVHPDVRLREAAEGCERDVQGLVGELGLDRVVYDAIAAVDATGLDDDTRRFQAKALREGRRSGVDKDDATRAALKALRERMVELGQTFSRNIRSANPKVTAQSAQLAGLPADFVAARAPNAAGLVELGVDYPTLIPVLTYAHDEGLRRALSAAALDRGSPANGPVLLALLDARHAYATRLGYPSWAQYMAEDKMIGSAANIEKLIADMAALGRPRMERERKELLAAKRTLAPKAKAIEAWDRFYVVDKLRKTKFDFDAQVARPYFEYRATLAGMFALYGELFGLEIRRLEDAPVWHPSVEAYAILEGGRVIGRFYLDMHPRPDKYGHAAMFPMVTGLVGGAQPEAALVCNFPAPGAVPALMEHKDVTTLFHEFGHLVHHLLAQSSPWVTLSGINTEWDFVEAPSQLLEEWTWDAAVLQRFARHVETGAPIPAALVGKLRRSSEFGKGMEEMRQVLFAAISYDLHARDPKGLDLDAAVRALNTKYSPYPEVPGTHMHGSFGHLEGYSSMYYTYRWSLVLAKDVFTRFESAGLLDAATARAYRDEVLRPGGRRDARQLVEAFLGRAPSLEAYRRWIERD